MQETRIQEFHMILERFWYLNEFQEVLESFNQVWKNLKDSRISLEELKDLSGKV